MFTSIASPGECSIAVIEPAYVVVGTRTGERALLTRNGPDNTSIRRILITRFRPYSTRDSAHRSSLRLRRRRPCIDDGWAFLPVVFLRLGLLGLTEIVSEHRNSVVHILLIGTAILFISY